MINWIHAWHVFSHRFQVNIFNIYIHNEELDKLTRKGSGIKILKDMGFGGVKAENSPFFHPIFEFVLFLVWSKEYNLKIMVHRATFLLLIDDLRAWILQFFKSWTIDLERVISLCSMNVETL